jgi:lipopolysaccharide transport system ATP-binding protein
MNDVSKGEGRTVLFVSHNILAIKQLCNKGMLLQNGTLKNLGQIDKIVNEYSENTISSISKENFFIKKIGLFINEISINKNMDGKVYPFEKFIVKFKINSQQIIKKIGFQIMIYNEEGSLLLASNSKTTNNIDLIVNIGESDVLFEFESFNFSSGQYWLGIAIDEPFVESYFHEKMFMKFEVEKIIRPPRLLSTDSIYGQFYLDNNWSIFKSSHDE